MHDIIITHLFIDWQLMPPGMAEASFTLTLLYTTTIKSEQI